MPKPWEKYQQDDPPPASPAPPAPAAPGTPYTPQPWYKTAAGAATTVWPYVTSFADQAARGFVGEAAQKGQDIGGYIPGGISEAYGDPELARTRQEALGTLTREYTGKEDPEHPITGAIGRFVGETAVPAAISSVVPVPIGKLAERGLVKGGKWLMKDATKGVAPTITQKGVKGAKVNPAWTQAKIANREAQERLEQRGAKWGGRIQNVERGALAGALQPTQDPSEAAAIGGGTGLAIEAAKIALGPKFKGVINTAAAGAAATAISQILPGGLEHIAVWGPVEWSAYKSMYALADSMMSAGGKAVASRAGEAVTAGTVARGAEAIQGKDRPTITVPRRAE